MNTYLNSNFKSKQYDLDLCPSSLLVESKDNYSEDNDFVDEFEPSLDQPIPSGLKELLRRFKKYQLEYVQCGNIDSVADGIARVYGLDGAQAGELIEGRECVFTIAETYYWYVSPGSLGNRFSGFRASNATKFDMLRLTNSIFTKLLREPVPLLKQTTSKPLPYALSHSKRFSIASRTVAVNQGDYKLVCLLYSKREAKSKQTRFSINLVYFNCGGTFHMAGKRFYRKAARSETTVVEVVQFDQKSELFLFCEVSQLDHFISIAIKLMIKMKKVDWEIFYIIDLAYALRGIKILTMHANSCKGHLGELNLIKILSNPAFLLYCYGLIKRTSAVGIDYILTNGVTSKGLLKLAADIKSSHYRPRPTKRVMIPKADKRKLRPLGIASTRDKVVQQAMKLILEPIFEPTFSTQSHGFRPGKSCHSALKFIDQYWPNTTWFLEFDFEKAFDKLNHRFLMAQLCNRYNEKAFNNIFWKMLTTGYILPLNLVDSCLDLNEGTPQGSILSPLASNIYFHQLDLWVEKVLIPKYTVKLEARRISEQYLDAVDRWTNNPWVVLLKNARALAPSISNIKVKRGLRAIRVEEAKAKQIQYYTKSGITRLTYTRYADDFLLGFCGTKDVSRNIVQEIVHYCESVLKMRVNIEKTHINHKSQGVLFLGYKIWLDKDLQTGKESTEKQRAHRTKMKFSVPIEKLYQRYTEKGFFQIGKKFNSKNIRHVARRQDKYAFLQPYYTVSRYNAVVRGLLNYYSGSERIHSLYGLIYDLRRSCALTLAHHKKQRMASWAFKKWGSDLTIKLSSEFDKKPKSRQRSISFYFPKLIAKKGLDRWNSGDINTISRNKIVGFSVPQTLNFIKKASDLNCCIPNCTKNASQWHHINHRRKVGGSGTSRVQVLAMARQIPVCSEHHHSIHSGKYDGPSLKQMKGYEI